MKNLNEYLDFKTKQYIRISGFDTKQDNAKEKLSEAVKPLMKEWVAEAIAAGC